MLKFFLSVICSTLSYSLLIFFTKNNYIKLDKGMLQIFLHVNIINFLLMILFYRLQKIRNKINFTIKETFFGKKELLLFILLFLPIFASFIKAKLMDFVPLSSIVITEMIIPLFIWLLAVIILKEKFNKKLLPYLFVALFGFFITNFNKISSFNISFIGYLLIYAIIDASGEISTRYYARTQKNGLQAVIAEMMVYFIYGCILLTINKSFSLSLLFNKYVFIVAIICFLHHMISIYGIREVKTIISVEVLTFLKPILTCIWLFILIGELPSVLKIIGGITIGISVIGFRKHSELNRK